MRASTDAADTDTIGTLATAAERLKRKEPCMESSAYPMLFSPIKVGTTEVKNRVFMPPVSTNLADHGYVTAVSYTHLPRRIHLR